MDIPNGPIAARVMQAGQAHIYRWWPELSADEQLALQSQAGSIDYDVLEAAIQGYLKGDKADFSRLVPARSVELDDRSSARAEAVGKQAIRNSKVCSLVLAGGLGTRLGFGLPKGLYPIGPVTGKSLFQWFAEKIKFICQWAGAPGLMPWAILTSEATHAETVSFLRYNDFFGLPEEGVHFFQQGMLPAVDLQGKLIMDSKWHICENPDGHGGIVSSLGKNGLLEHLTRLGIEQIFIHNVDNCQVKICDPVFLGHHLLTDADFSCKSVRKRAADETLATIARENGRLKLIEYSDIPEEAANLRDDQGRLVFENGSINTFFMRVDFFQRLVREHSKFPLHATLKMVDSMDHSGSLLQPQAPNAIRFEKKIFDALQYTDKASLMSANRAEEFSPLKNSQGLESFTTVSHDLQAMYVGWFHSSGIPLPEDRLTAIEIGPLFAKDLPAFQERIAQMGRSAFSELIKQQIEEKGWISL
jgi:UDP-N-acetylglucosamine/UDP-N-acetylgalactosamine diphosphorylase